MRNYWSYRIYETGYDGAPVFVAEYIAATDAEAVKTDLASDLSELKGYLEGILRIDPEEFSRKFPNQAEKLLGGLAANTDLSLRFGRWTSELPPPAKSLPPQSELGQPTRIWHGVLLWLRQTGNANADAP